MGHSGRGDPDPGGNCYFWRPFLKLNRRFAAAGILLILISQTLTAQSGELNGPYTEPLPYQDVEFPQWAHDLRRFEVITIGAFPLSYILTSLVYETVKFATDNERGFSIYSEKSQKDLSILLMSSGAISIGIATADLIIGKTKQKKLEKQNYTEIPAQPPEEETDD